MSLRVTVEGPRGCGHRKTGGLYLISEGVMSACGGLPMEMTVCRCCGQGIKQARGWTWIQPKELFPMFEPPSPMPSITCGVTRCLSCPVGGSKPERAGLVWIGESFYPTPEEFLQEARRMGVSRRITVVPKGFVVGSTWVFVGHKRAISHLCPDCNGIGGYCDGACKGSGTIDLPGIFHAFLPTRIEKVYDETPDDEEIEGLEKRGIDAVVVKRVNNQGELL